MLFRTAGRGDHCRNLMLDQCQVHLQMISWEDAKYFRGPNTRATGAALEDSHSLPSSRHGQIHRHNHSRSTNLFPNGRTSEQLRATYQRQITPLDVRVARAAAVRGAKTRTHSGGKTGADWKGIEGEVGRWWVQVEGWAWRRVPA